MRVVLCHCVFAWDSDSRVQQAEERSSRSPTKGADVRIKSHVLNDFALFCLATNSSPIPRTPASSKAD